MGTLGVFVGYSITSKAAEPLSVRLGIYNTGILGYLTNPAALGWVGLNGMAGVVGCIFFVLALHGTALNNHGRALLYCLWGYARGYILAS
jgi:hypothetical protein